MRTIALFLGLITTAWLAVGTNVANAQATRTWVSGVGDDANPCSRTAPCKTFAGAISKTAAGGEIDALDPGGFGGLTITKAITIDGGGGQVASVLVAGTNGITVTAGVNGVVILRNIRINGLGHTAAPGINGISFVAGAALQVESCAIFGFSNAAIDVNPNQAATVTISDTTLTNSSGGIQVRANSASNVLVSLNRVRMNQNSGFGLRANGSSGSGAVFVTLTDSQAADNGGSGIVSLSGPGPTFVVVNRSTIVNNGANGIQSDQSAGGSSRVFVNESIITGNGNMASSVAGGVINTYTTNVTEANFGSNTGFTATQTLK